VERRTVVRADLVELARAGLGRELVTVTPMRGGTRKGVHRLTFEDDSTAVLYTWDPAADYWPELDEDPASPFTADSGIDLFDSARTQLEALGVRTPRVHLLDRSRTLYPADIAVVEDVRGQRTDRTLPALGDALRAMARHEGAGFGKLRGGTAQDQSCEQVVLERALGHLAQAAARVERVGAARDELEHALRSLAGAIEPRTRYGLVHGELGPEHVLVGTDGLPVIIDIEGLMFFDVEWEHAFLRFRFGEDYRWLEVDGLDERRLDFYRLALHLSLIEGPLRLLDGDFLHRAGMLEIVEANIVYALEFLR
jgi:hypothetical protein